MSLSVSPKRIPDTLCLLAVQLTICMFIGPTRLSISSYSFSISAPDTSPSICFVHRPVHLTNHRHHQPYASKVSKITKTRQHGPPALQAAAGSSALSPDAQSSAQSTLSWPLFLYRRAGWPTRCQLSATRPGSITSPVQGSRAVLEPRLMITKWGARDKQHWSEWDTSNAAMGFGQKAFQSS
ncbi:uncharacterized protein J3D65DRAFT_626330 [Phyllosticta citribraziliensis]|uniref:Uncharacterized protein n=1 Tax=Phyllosticta citribraziliensis TaxID=989973 RepID=A0ABR1LKT7_9PEZI